MAWGKRTGVDDLLERLTQSATSKSLYVLSTRKITEGDAKRLADTIAVNTQLEELYLSGHRLGQDGLQAFANCLAVNKTLKHVCAGDDTLGDDGVKTLCEGIGRNPLSGLQVWDLEHKSIGLCGAAALGELLKNNSSLNTLTLSRNALGDEGVEKIVTGLRSNDRTGLKTLLLTEAALTGTSLDSMAMLLELSTCSLQTLQLSFNTLGNASPAFFNALAKNTSLKKLQLKQCALNDQHMKAMGNALKFNTALEVLDLSDNALTEAACTFLSEGLKENTSLKVLNLGNNKCLDAGAVSLGEVLSSSNSSLLHLDMSNNELTHVGMTAVLGSQSVKKLHVFNNALKDGIHHVIPALLANTCIETFDLGANELHGELSIVLFNALHAHPSLKTLEMGGNSLGDEGHAALDKLREVNRDLDVAVDKNAQDENGDFNFQ